MEIELECNNCKVKHKRDSSYKTKYEEEIECGDKNHLSWFYKDHLELCDDCRKAKWKGHLTNFTTVIKALTED